MGDYINVCTCTCTCIILMWGHLITSKNIYIYIYPVRCEPFLFLSLPLSFSLSLLTIYHLVQHCNDLSLLKAQLSGAHAFIHVYGHIFLCVQLHASNGGGSCAPTTTIFTGNIRETVLVPLLSIYGWGTGCKHIIHLCMALRQHLICRGVGLIINR